MSDLRARTLATLREGRVTVLHAERTDYTTTPSERLLAAVRSSRQGGPTYAVDYRDQRWTCTCRDGAHDRPCVHIAAVQLVTGHDTPARKVAAA